VTEVLQIHTRQLRLRRSRPEDAPAISAYRSLPEVARYQSWETFGIEEAKRFISDQLAVEPVTPGSWLQLMITLVESGQLIGDFGIHFISHAQVELGITLDPRYQHRGLACEALEGMQDPERVAALSFVESLQSWSMLLRFVCVLVADD
jgi:RimJ/RimL family protein N-acetyltransferase